MSGKIDAQDLRERIESMLELFEVIEWPGLVSLLEDMLAFLDHKEAEEQ